MFFKKLELFGFKSFAGKTKIDFEPGVTAVVGPNGCGKSNIADSIKWVLGEQSVRSMRGAKMEDIIFHGADDISPVGFAEVSLTISNQSRLLPLDYEEVAITRRLFRSGESEYLINKVPVRLKDIQELLMGTGLGVHSYSLMEQGKVDQILSSRPEDRRAIFEEAGGITKYKSKREEALRKLQRTQENLQRLGDIIVEVKRQIKSIERQVNRARRYKEEFEQLKRDELEVAQYHYAMFKKEKDTFEDKRKELESEEKALSSKIDTNLQALLKRKQDLSVFEGTMSSIQAQSYEVGANIKAAENKKVLNAERTTELVKRTRDIEQQMAYLQQKMGTISDQIQEVQNQIETAEQQKQAKSVFVVEKEEEINNILSSVKQAQKKVASEQAQEVEIIAQQAQARNSLTKLEANLANFNARLRRLNVESSKTEQELTEIDRKYSICTEGLNSLNEQLRRLTKELGTFKDSLRIKLESRQKLDLRLEDSQRRITALSSKLNFLQEISKKYEGYSRGVRSILTAKDTQLLNIDGVYGVVADLIEVLPGYQIAVEMALGENIQVIIVENKQAAYTAVNYLKEKDAGRASFICLDSLEFKDKEAVKLRQTINESAATKFVKTAPKFQKTIEHLLANTFIIQDLKAASQLLKQIDSGTRLITLDGEVVTKASLIGGSLAHNLEVSLLGRRERVAQTQADLEEINKEKVHLENLRAGQEADIAEINKQIQQNEPDLNKLTIALANKKNEILSIEAERKRLGEETSVLTLEIDETKEQIQGLQGEQEDLNRQLEDCTNMQRELQNNISEQQGLIAEKNQQRQDTLVQIAEAKAQLSGLQRQGEEAKTKLQMVLESETEQKAFQGSMETENQDITLKIQQLQEEVVQLDQRTKELSQQKLSLEGRLNQDSQKRQRLSLFIQDEEEKARVRQKGVSQISEKRASLQLKLTELNYKQESLKTKMYQSYHVDLEIHSEEALVGQAPQESIIEEIKRLKTKLEGMGPVNLVAIEENEQLQQRYSFLISQQEDLIKAQESLRKAISQINSTARRIFSETFQKIQVSFKEYFRILFGGGDARLVLIDENNLLESGIEIVIRPPGKRLQNISLLSGGEKALTAIALLFAIFKIKPSPFCILDEVDAPLDEANVDRFTRLLSEFIKTSQFIIITHNKKTINMADVMYGITMERSGISKIVSVRFTPLKESSPEDLKPVLTPS